MQILSIGFKSGHSSDEVYTDVHNIALFSNELIKK